MRLRRVYLLVACASAALFYLLVQLRLSFIARVRDDSTTSNITMSMNIGGTHHKTSIHHSGQTIHDNIRQFVEVMNHNSIIVFLFDPIVIRHMTANITLLSWRCKSACPVKTFTAFGVLSQFWKPTGPHLRMLHSAGFRVIHFTQPDPRLLTVNATSNHTPVPTHYVFEKGGHSIQLVVFYERGHGRYWWHGKMTGAQAMFAEKGDFTINPSEFPYGQYAGAFDRIDTLKLTIDGLHLRIPRNPLRTLHQIAQSRFIECDYARAKAFYAKHSLIRSDDADAFRDSATRLLFQAQHVLDELGVRFWLSSGTCLGWFRQCGLIPHSKDVDIGIWIKDYDIRLIPAMQVEGIAIKQLFGKVQDSFELSFQGGDIKLDIFFFYEEERYMWNGGTQARTGKKFKYRFPNFHVCWTEFLSMKVRIPCETESYIEANYGKNWFEPVTAWDWKKSPPNVIENGQWPKDQWKRVIQLY